MEALARGGSWVTVPKAFAAGCWGGASGSGSGEQTSGWAEERPLCLQAPGSGWKEVSTGCVKQWGPEHFEAERRK